MSFESQKGVGVAKDDDAKRPHRLNAHQEILQLQLCLRWPFRLCDLVYPYMNAPLLEVPITSLLYGAQILLHTKSQCSPPIMVKLC